MRYVVRKHIQKKLGKPEEKELTQSILGKENFRAQIPSQLELKTFEILAAERLRLMEFDNRSLIVLQTS